MTDTIDTQTLPNFVENLSALVDCVSKLENPTLAIIAQGFTFALVKAGETSDSTISKVLDGKSVVSVVYSKSLNLFKSTEQFVLEDLASSPYEFLTISYPDDYFHTPSGQILLTSIQSEALIGYMSISHNEIDTLSAETARQRAVIFWLFVESICGLGVPHHVKVSLLNTLNISEVFFQYIGYNKPMTLIESMYRQLTVSLPESYLHAVQSFCKTQSEPGILFSKLNATDSQESYEERFHHRMYRNICAPCHLSDMVPCMNGSHLITDAFFRPIKDITVVKELLRWGAWVYNTSEGSSGAMSRSRNGWYTLINAYLMSSTWATHPLVKDYLIEKHPSRILGLTLTLRARG